MLNDKKNKKIIINKFTFMFEHRLSKFCRAFLLALSLLLVGGMQQSCKDWLDEYKYDNSEPDWLGASIYAFLQEGTPSHSYRNYVELIDSLGERETLEKTGSKTLFVADDAAFAKFFENNPWGVKSVAGMTKAQRQFLFYNTMLPNAVLLDMMPNTSANSEGDCISRDTEFNPLDYMPLVHKNYYPNHPSWPTYNQYWELFAKDKDALLLATTSPSMVHFFNDYLKRNAISVSDINFLFQKGGNAAKKYTEGDIFIYGNKLVDGEVDAGNFSEDKLTIVCKNGYVYRMDDVLLPPADMAGELRNREDTRIFSHLLDRFCIPVFDSGLTGDYRKHHNVEEDSVYKLRYFTKSFNGGSLFNGTGVAAPDVDSEVLDYDPGVSKGRNDVYAMLVPNDEALYKYFAEKESDEAPEFHGAGNFLIKRYAPEVQLAADYRDDFAVETLLKALDSIPQVSIATFINNLMQESFAATVPSKFDRITNDANDDMKIVETDVDECLIANNGVIYILNKVFSPAKFSSVAGPVDINDNMRVMKNFINSLKYNYYLLAMDADYSLIIPDDENFVYYDPFTFDDYEEEGKMKMYAFHYDSNREKNTAKTPELWYEEFEIDKKTLEIDTLLNEVEGGKNDVATDLLEYLIIVHDKVDPRIRKDRLYYSTKGYGTIKIVSDESGVIKFYGGEQLEKGEETTIIATEESVIPQENGVTYPTKPMKTFTETFAETSTETSTEDYIGKRYYSSVPTPPTKSVYQNMLAHNGKDNDGLYEEFFKLCYPQGDKFKTLRNALEGIYGKSLEEDTVKLYSIFYTGGNMRNCVPFLNTYHYTVYIPSNESILGLYDLGLPQWSAIEDEVGKNPQRAMSLIRLRNSFVRYHFQDYSVYCDLSPFYLPDPAEVGGMNTSPSLATSLINNTTGRFYELTVKSEGGTIVLEDDWVRDGETTQWARVVNTRAEDENKTWNVMCRDRVGTKSIETSSYSVLQPIDRALLNKSFFGYDGLFARYAVNGHRVDTMTVVNGKGGNAGINDKCYLVAKAGRIISTSDVPQPEYLKNAEIAYLMKPLNSLHPDYSDISHEVLVNDENKEPILITRDGFRVAMTLNPKNKAVTYDYYTETDDDGKKYKIKVNNNGDEIGRELFEVNEPETDDSESEAENGSNGDNSDEE